MITGSPSGPNDRVASEDLDPERGRRAERRVAQADSIEGMAEHAFVTMVEPLEPAGVDRRPALLDAVEFDEIAGHMRLGDHEGDSPSREAAQSLAPARVRRRVHDVVALRRMEVVALDPSAVSRAGPLRVGRDDLTDRRGNVVSREELDHAVTVGVADGVGRIDDDRPGFLHCGKTVENLSSLAHRENIGVRLLDEIPDITSSTAKPRSASAEETLFMMAASSSTRPGECPCSR